MKDVEAESMRNGDSGELKELTSELDRLQFNERIAHLQRRARIQRQIIQRLIGSERKDFLADMQVIMLALEEMEDRNLVLEDAMKTVRTQISAGYFYGGGNEAPQNDNVLQGVDDPVLGSLGALIHVARLEAERLRAEGNYKGARRLLRRARSRKVLAGSGLQMLAISRYWIVRALFSFYRYR